MQKNQAGGGVLAELPDRWSAFERDRSPVINGEGQYCLGVWLRLCGVRLLDCVPEGKHSQSVIFPLRDPPELGGICRARAAKARSQNGRCPTFTQITVSSSTNG